MTETIALCDASASPETRCADELPRRAHLPVPSPDEDEEEENVRRSPGGGNIDPDDDDDSDEDDDDDDEEDGLVLRRDAASCKLKATIRGGRGTIRAIVMACGDLRIS